MDEEVYYVQVFLGLGWADLHFRPLSHNDAMRFADDYVSSDTSHITLRIERRDGLGENSEIWRTPGSESKGEPAVLVRMPVVWQKVGF